MASNSNTVHAHVTLAVTLSQVLRCEQKERAVVEGTYHTGLPDGPCSCSILGPFSCLTHNGMETHASGGLSSVVQPDTQLDDV